MLAGRDEVTNPDKPWRDLYAKTAEGEGQLLYREILRLRQIFGQISFSRFRGYLTTLTSIMLYCTNPPDFRDSNHVKVPVIDDPEMVLFQFLYS